MKIPQNLLLVVSLVTFACTAQGALVNNLNGTVTDTNTNLIWLQNWNVNGRQYWGTQNAWADTSLDGFAGSSEWHLPSIQQYLDLFTEYGDLTSNTLPFTQVQLGDYWSSETSPLLGTARLFGTGDGHLTVSSDTLSYAYAVGVRSGDVVASVPEPQTLALVLLALGITMIAGQRARRSHTLTPNV